MPLYQQRFTVRVFVVFLLLLLFFVIGNLTAQTSSKNNRSSKGKDFWITFMPNFHEIDRTRPTSKDSLFLYITSDVPTQGLIVYKNRQNQEFRQAFQISNPAQVYIFGVSYRTFELEGFNDNTLFNANYQSERVAPQHFHVTSEQDVTVYGLNQAFFTSDAFLALPITALGREYLVMSYNSDGDARYSTQIPSNATPSEFAIVATEDKTTIQIFPKAPAFRSKSAAPQTVALNRGESYLIQADVAAGTGTADLTGSRIIASQPIAVFAGHQRAVIPVELQGADALSISTRDHLVEQLPPLESWGKTALLTPYSRPSTSELGVGTDLFRVLAAFDNTKVIINGTERTLNAGEFFQDRLTGTGIITANEQILVAQFKKTSSSQANQFNGDPFMMIIPTREQYDTAYRFVNMAVKDRDLIGAGIPSGDVFEEHYVTMVIPSQGAGSVRIDNAIVGAGSFQAIGNSGYSFANIRVSAGVHTARADSVFAIYVYGYGRLNSYGYIGGGNFRIVAPDRHPPVIVGKDSCFSHTGMVYDSLITDSGIKSVEFLPTPLGNVTSTLENFTPYPDSVGFSLRLNNIFADGSSAVSATDSIGFRAQKTILIPGFTTSFENQGPTGLAIQRLLTIETGRSRIFRFTVTNHGATTQATICTLEQTAGLDIGSPKFFGAVVTAPQYPLTADARLATTAVIGNTARSLFIALAPQQSTTITIQYDAQKDGESVIQLIGQRIAVLPPGVASVSLIQPLLSCGSRVYARLTFRSNADTTKPIIAATPDYCTQKIAVEVRDPEPFPSGIQSVTIIGECQNCRLELQPIQNSLVVQGILTTINPRLDAVYSVQVRDSAGNTSILRDTVQGFTLQIVAEQRDSVGNFGQHPITDFVCRTITYNNYGLKPFLINNWAPVQNLHFSLPASQFPVTIAPSSSKTFTVCFAPLEARQYSDTLLLEQFCVTDRIILTGTGTPLVRSDNTRCNAEIILTTKAAPRHFFMEQNFPNPTSLLSTITFGIEKEDQIVLRLYNALGEHIVTLLQQRLIPGLYDVMLQTSMLEQGVYYYTLQSSTRQITKQLHVIK